MKKYLATFLALMLLVTGLAPIAAQDSGPALATGTGSPATWYDERGRAMATVEVTEVMEEWTDYSEYSAPSPGVVFRAVKFNINNIGDTNLIVEPYDFSMVDTSGRNTGRTYVSESETSTMPVFSDDTALAAGETGEFLLVFEMYDDVFPSVLVWQPESGKLVMVDLEAELGDTPAKSSGLDAPVTWTDDRGRPMATFTVTNVQLGWEDFDDFYEPEVGTHYVAVHFTVENLSSGNLIVEPYDLSLVDSDGTNTGRSWTSTADGLDYTLFEEDTPLAAGETMEGVIVFQTTTDVSPAALLWQPDSGLFNLVTLEGVESASPEASPVASPASGEETDPVASPAAVTSATSGEATEINSDPVPFNDVIGEEQGEISVATIQDGWDGYDDANAPFEGEHYFLVDVAINSTGDDDLQVSPLDFYLILEDGTEVRSDMILNSDTASPQVLEASETVTAGGTTIVTIPFLIEDGDAPAQIKWTTGQDEPVVDLQP